jgi:putative FmdB family regulatory protein
MPIYEYTCASCHKTFDRLVRSSADESTAACPECGSKKTQKKLSVFAVGAESPKAASAAPAPGMCGRCGGPGPCAMGG